ncbi:MAG: MFS transporter [Mariniblastus sp.]|nr:MFS transporter [Mariniblastus sp.]
MTNEPLPSDPISISTGQRIAILIAAGMAQFLVCVDYWSVAIAMPAMAEDFGVRTIDLQWVITGYVLTFSVVLGIAGPLGDRYGRKKILLIGIAIFGLVSLWVGAAQSANSVIAARVALGIGGGLLLPLAASVLANCTPSDQMPRFMALLTAVTALGASTGPVLGGILTDSFLGWRWIFYVNIPFSLLAFFMVMFLARESRDPQAHGRLDALGILLVIGSLSLLSLGFDRIPHWTVAAWSSSLLGGFLFLGLFIIWELKVQNPIIDLRLISNRAFTGYTLAGLFSNSCWCILIFTTTLLLQKVSNLDALDTGLYFLFLSGSVVVSSTIAAKISDRTGSKPLVVIALALQGGAFLALWFDHQLAFLAACLAVSGIGCAWGWSMPQAGAILTLPRERVGLASGSILTVMVMVANLFVVISATIIDAMSGANGDDYASGIQVSYLIGVGLAVAGLLAVVLILPSRLSTEEEHPLEPDRAPAPRQD